MCCSSPQFCYDSPRSPDPGARLVLLGAGRGGWSSTLAWPLEPVPPFQPTWPRGPWEPRLALRPAAAPASSAGGPGVGQGSAPRAAASLFGLQAALPRGCELRQLV